MTLILERPKVSPCNASTLLTIIIDETASAATVITDTPSFSS